MTDIPASLYFAVQDEMILRAVACKVPLETIAQAHCIGLSELIRILHRLRHPGHGRAE